MLSISSTRIHLDYAAAGMPTLLANLSGIARAGDFVWTVSDEGRTVECLRDEGAGYRLQAQVSLDRLVPGIPGADDDDELDLELVDVADGFLWLCGSHCRVRRKPDAPDELNDQFRNRPSRHLLAAIKLKDGGARLGRARRLPFSGKGGLRHALKDDPYLAPFLELPSKENGLDIEGIAVRPDCVMLGLRGPLLDSIAVVVRLKLNKAFAIAGYELRFLDLGGLAIRDLASNGDDVLVLAGPVTDAPGPFRLYVWRPAGGRRIQTPTRLFVWPDGTEKPEGLCPAVREGRPGVLVVYDRATVGSRIFGATHAADWLTGL